MRLALALVTNCLAACGGDAAPGSDTTDSAADTLGDVAEVLDISDEVDATPDTSPPTPWFERAVMYEIFVRSFQDSDGDGIGDLRGLIDRLDYLNDGVPGAGDDLEVDGIWLMPIFASDSYHGYDTTDYRAINADYGTDADFEALVAACDARGIRVVLDLVMNHSGERHPWFTAARSSPSDPHRNWYVWRGDDPGWKQPFGNAKVWHPFGGAFYYGVFWSGMPDLNYREPAVVAEMTDVARDWLQRGAAGFRLDAARYLVESADGALFEQPETHAFWKSFRADLPDDAYLVGEVWTNRDNVTTYWGGGDELHQAFDFDLQGSIEYAITERSTTRLRAELAAQVAAGTPWSYAATFLSNHDLDRLSRRLTDEEQRAAAFLLMTLPGTPYLYYGDELGAKSAPKIGDEAKRGPMAWTADAGHGFSTGTPWVAFAPEGDVRNISNALENPASLLRYYQALIRVRRGHPALAGPGLTVVPDSESGVFAMLRSAEGEVLLAVVNLSDAASTGVTLDLSEAVSMLGAGPWSIAELIGPGGSQGESRANDPATVPLGGSLAPREGRLWRLSRAPASEMQ